MTKQTFGILTVEASGRTTVQQVPFAAIPDLERAMVEAELLGPGASDADCPVCAVLRANGFDAPEEHLRPRNRAERRAAAARARRRRVA